MCLALGSSFTCHEAATETISVRMAKGSLASRHLMGGSGADPGNPTEAGIATSMELVV